VAASGFDRRGRLLLRCRASTDGLGSGFIGSLHPALGVFTSTGSRYHLRPAEMFVSSSVFCAEESSGRCQPSLLLSLPPLFEGPGIIHQSFRSAFVSAESIYKFRWGPKIVLFVVRNSTVSSLAILRRAASRQQSPIANVGTTVLPLFLCMCLGGCTTQKPQPAPAIEFTKVPFAQEGNPDSLDAIEGRVTGGKSGQRIVLFAKSGPWWVQPMTNQPFTTVGSDSTWKNSTHYGLEYAALLVDPGYHPPGTTDTLPTVAEASRCTSADTHPSSRAQCLRSHGFPAS
jgi:hypothetical protein